jgi:undecaprenyl-diphosphatase
MIDWLEAMVLGAVQGLTEFLPVSSDGHLAITQQAFARFGGRHRTGAENLFFDVMLHLGTLAAIVVYHRAVVSAGMRGLLASNEVPEAFRRPALIRTGLLAGLATLPLVPDALFLKDYLERAFESTMAAGIGFLITAAVLAVTLWLPGGSKGPAETTWRDALMIGIAQMFAPLPGVSRSGLTVATALGVGLSRTWAVGFSLLMAIPAILGAAVFELRKVDPSFLTADRVTRTAMATLLAGVVGYGAIVWLVKAVRSGRLWCFSVYLVVLGAVVIALAARP